MLAKHLGHKKKTRLSFPHANMLGLEDYERSFIFLGQALLKLKIEKTRFY